MKIGLSFTVHSSGVDEEFSLDIQVNFRPEHGLRINRDLHCIVLKILNRTGIFHYS